MTFGSLRAHAYSRFLFFNLRRAGTIDLRQCASRRKRKAFDSSGIRKGTTPMRFALAAALLFSVVVAEDGRAASKVEIQAGDQKYAMPHVQAVKVIREDGASQVVLLFTEQAAEKVVLVDDFGGDDLLSLGSWATESGVLAARLSFTEGAEENYSLTLHAGSDSVSVGGHQSGGESKGPFRKLTIKENRISGDVYHPAPPSTLSGTFDVPLRIVRAPKWTSGDAVVRSPQATVLLAYAAAMRKLDFATATRYSVNDEVVETKRAIEALGEKRMKAMLRETFLTEKEFSKLLGSADVSMAETPGATRFRIVRRQGTETETSTITLLKTDGEWKVRF
jgi:hypothetical protein